MTADGMTARERVFAALEFRAPDVVPAEYHASPAGSYEHGAQMHELFGRYPHDFGDASAIPLARPEPQWVDSRGKYQEFRRDEWGVIWEHLIFGVAGHPHTRPLDDWANLEAFQPPPLPATSGPAFERERMRTACDRQNFFIKSGWISIFEVMHALRRFEDVLMDLATDSPEINHLADIITDYQLRTIHYLLARGVDAIQFGDDYATQSGLMMSPATWRRFFKPRYELLMKPVHAAGKKVFFHTCGCGLKILDDIADLRVHAIWPQLNVYSKGELARFCRETRIAIALHPDRGDLMIRSKPADVRSAVLELAEEFSVSDGGAWFYVEIDSGFPFQNIEALIETIGRLRGF
jgi:uroporphyrinogen decarboxylase